MRTSTHPWKSVPKIWFYGFHHVWIYWFILRVDDLVVLNDLLFSPLLSGFRFRFWVSGFFISLSNCLKPWLNRLFCCSIPLSLIEKWICIQDLSQLVKNKEDCPYYKWFILKDDEDVTFSFLSAKLLNISEHNKLTIKCCNICNLCSHTQNVGTDLHLYTDLFTCYRR